MPSEPNCPFCRAVVNPAAAWGDNLVWMFPHSFAVLGPWQYFTGYCMLISRDHAAELSQLGTKRTAFLDEMAVLAEAIESCFRPHKLNYELLGNQVPHLHWHLFRARSMTRTACVPSGSTWKKPATPPKRHDSKREPSHARKLRPACGHGWLINSLSELMRFSRRCVGPVWEAAEHSAYRPGVPVLHGPPNAGI